MRILFIGNSYVFFNDLPGLVQRLAEAGSAALEAESVAYGGTTLLRHLKRGETVQAGDGAVRTPIDLPPDQVTFLQRVAWESSIPPASAVPLQQAHLLPTPRRS